MPHDPNNPNPVLHRDNGVTLQMLMEGRWRMITPAPNLSTIYLFEHTEAEACEEADKWRGRKKMGDTKQLIERLRPLGSGVKDDGFVYLRKSNFTALLDEAERLMGFAEWWWRNNKAAHVVFQDVDAAINATQTPKGEGDTND